MDCVFYCAEQGLVSYWEEEHLPLRSGSMARFTGHRKRRKKMQKISRKNFLRTAGAAAAAAAVTPLLGGWAWPRIEDHEQYQGDVVLLLSNDIHSNLTTSKTMNPDGSTKIMGGAARRRQRRRWCAAKPWADLSPWTAETTPREHRIRTDTRKAGRSWRWHRWKWIFAPWATTNLMWATRRW